MSQHYLATKTNTSKPTSTGRLAVASAVGTTLEWYDFTVYNTLAALIFNRRTTTGISLYIEGTLCVTLVALLLARETAKSSLEE